MESQAYIRAIPALTPELHVEECLSPRSHPDPFQIRMTDRSVHASKLACQSPHHTTWYSIARSQVDTVQIEVRYQAYLTIAAATAETIAGHRSVLRENPGRASPPGVIGQNIGARSVQSGGFKGFGSRAEPVEIELLGPHI